MGETWVMAHGFSGHRDEGVALPSRALRASAQWIWDAAGSRHKDPQCPVSHTMPGEASLPDQHCGSKAHRGGVEPSPSQNPCRLWSKRL